LDTLMVNEMCLAFPALQDIFQPCSANKSRQGCRPKQPKIDDEEEGGFLKFCCYLICRTTKYKGLFFFASLAFQGQ